MEYNHQNSLHLLRVIVKGEGHSEQLIFLSSPLASKTFSFSLTEVSAAKVPAIPKKFVSKEAISETAILKAGRVYVT